MPKTLYEHDMEDSLRQIALALGVDVSGTPDVENVIRAAGKAGKDAARYRWLRDQHWNTAELCVVMDPKDAVKLGRTCPSGEYLDIAVDDAMLIGRAVGAA